MIAYHAMSCYILPYNSDASGSCVALGDATGSDSRSWSRGWPKHSRLPRRAFSYGQYPY